MIRGLHKASTVFVLAVGVIHTASTFFTYYSLNESAVWFAGAGLCGIFVALLNMALWLPEAPALSRRSVAAANFLFFFWLYASAACAWGSTCRTPTGMTTPNSRRWPRRALMRAVRVRR